MPDKFGDKVRLTHLADAISALEKYTDGISQEQFLADFMRSDACIRQLEIIGEASNHLSEALIAASPSVGWAQIVGLRNIIAHEYFGVDLHLIWRIIQFYVPVLKEHVHTLLDRQDNDAGH